MQPLCNAREVERWLRVKIEYDIFIVILVIRGVLMGAIDFVKEAEEIAEKNLIEGKEITKKKVLTQRILKFICNEKNLDNKVKLLNFVKQISWYWSCQMNEFIKAQIEKLTTGNDLFIIKEVKASSSSCQIISNLANSGVMDDKNIRTINEITVESSESNKIFVVDDYIGSGNTILEKIVPKIEEIFEGKEIFIISFVCHKKGYDLIKEKTKNLSNFYYIINGVIEHDYKSKLANDEIVSYIDKICGSCSNKKFSFGYNDIGAMMVLNELSPNNNLSLIWRDDICYNGGAWIPLIDRNINLCILEKRKLDNIDKNRAKISRVFSDIKEIIEYEDFILLILVYNCCGITNHDIDTFKIFDDEEETRRRLNKLKNNDIITFD